MLGSIKKDRTSQIAIMAFVVFTLWWTLLLFSGLTSGPANLVFGATYGTFMSIYGGILGLQAAKKWGMFKSIMGKAIMVLSFGLFAQAFGQFAFSFYNIFLHVEIPYPSIADIGYFGNIPLYIAGIMMLSKASGINVSLKSYSSQIKAILIPGVILIASYLFFLGHYEFDWINPLKIFLDFGYPLGQALYVSIALLTYSLSTNILGGIMRKRILFLLLAFIAQYFADFNFLFQNNNGTWYNGGYGDYLYLIAYTLMTLGLIQLKVVASKLQT